MDLGQPSAPGMLLLSGALIGSLRQQIFDRRAVAQLLQLFVGDTGSE